MKKIKLCVFFLFLIFIFSFTTINASLNPLKNKIIFLDAGHGGDDGGASYYNEYESKLNLEIIKKLKDELEDNGAYVIMIRNDDYDLSAPLIKTRKRSDLYNRAKIINSSQADLYLSIHLNADANPTWHGAQIFYSNKNHENKKIADALKDSLNLNRENKMTNDLYMYRLITKPGCLIELGFLSNLSDKNKLSSSKYQEEIAKKITHALVKYYKL